MFNDVQKALFLERPNRFTLVCRLPGKIVSAFLPNPGRMWELLLPGTFVYLEKSQRPENKMAYTAVAVEREGYPVVVHTLKTNSIAERLIRKGLIPNLTGTEIVRREVTAGKSRFDFLLKRGEKRSTWR